MTTDQTASRNSRHESIRERFEGRTVRERLGDRTTGDCLQIRSDGLIEVRWTNGRQSIHTEDELELLDLVSDHTGLPNSTMKGDPFSGVRGYLPRFDD